MTISVSLWTGDSNSLERELEAWQVPVRTNLDFRNYELASDSHPLLVPADQYWLVAWNGSGNLPWCPTCLAFNGANGVSPAFEIVGSPVHVHPVPEPSTFTMMGAGLLPVIGVIRRRYLHR